MLGVSHFLKPGKNDVGARDYLAHCKVDAARLEELHATASLINGRTSIVSCIKDQASSHLAHAQYQSVQGVPPHPGRWPLPELAVAALVGAVRAVVARLDTISVGWFAPSLEATFKNLIARVGTCFDHLPVSQNPDVAALTSALRTHLNGLPQNL